MPNSKEANQASCLSVLGTGSDVGKSIVVTAICRILANRGFRVAPYKAQNMSNNSGVTPEGLEMGRAQIVQAEASGLPPRVDMNPILLKPTSEIGAQVVLMGKAVDNKTAKEYHTHKQELFTQACAALDRLKGEFDHIIMEGAGSCAEVNLMPHDIVNLRMTEYADAPVVLVADIHRGGVFAQIVGTLECLSQAQRDLIAGFIINRFRGDIELFTDGVRWIEQKTGKKVFGVLPWYDHIHIESEDSVVIESPAKIKVEKGKIPAIAVIRIPHISNFTDFDPLSNTEGLDLYFIQHVQDLSGFAAVIIPGSKNTCWDLRWLRTTGWIDALHAYADNNGHILGICGGYQMLGREVQDPDGLEGPPGATSGLNLLPVETILKAPKTTTLTRFSWNEIEGTGYEIHMGQTRRFGGDPLFKIHERNRVPMTNEEDGCAAPGDRVLGAYIHGLFDTPGIMKTWLNSVGLNRITVSDALGPVVRDREYNLLADHFEKHVDVEALLNCLK